MATQHALRQGIEFGRGPAVGPDDLRNAGRCCDDKCALILGGTDAKELGVLNVLFRAPVGGIHRRNGEKLRAVQGHAPHHILKIAVEADGCAYFPDGRHFYLNRLRSRPVLAIVEKMHRMHFAVLAENSAAIDREGRVLPFAQLRCRLI